MDRVARGSGHTQSSVEIFQSVKQKPNWLDLAAEGGLKLFASSELQGKVFVPHPLTITETVDSPARCRGEPRKSRWMARQRSVADQFFTWTHVITDFDGNFVVISTSLHYSRQGCVSLRTPF